MRKLKVFPSFPGNPPHSPTPGSNFLCVLRYLRCSPICIRYSYTTWARVFFTNKIDIFSQTRTIINIQFFIQTALRNTNHSVSSYTRPIVGTETNNTQLTSFAHFEAKLATRSAAPTSHGKGIFLTIVLCTSFAHFEAKLATRSADPTSHGKGIFLIILLCTSFAHFEAKLATRSPDPTSHGKGIFLSSVHLFCSLRSKAPLLLTHSKQYSLHSLLTRSAATRVSDITWQRNIPHHCSVHLFCSLRSKACDSVS